MGLDQFIYGCRYIPGNKTEKTKIIQSRECEWRKLNHIHRWFIYNIQDGQDDCRMYEVSEDELRELLEKCREVLANKNKAKEILPTMSGCFFGSTEYDDEYFTLTEEVMYDLERVIDMNYDWYTYSSSW